MKKLENKIIDKIYRFETKRTLTEILLRIAGIFCVGLMVGILGMILWVELVEQQTFDLLQLFQEDTAIIRKHLLDVLTIFYQEIPKTEFVLILTGLLIFISLTVVSVKKIKSIRNRLSAIINFHKHL